MEQEGQYDDGVKRANKGVERANEAVENADAAIARAAERRMNRMKKKSSGLQNISDSTQQKMSEKLKWTDKLTSYYDTAESIILSGKGLDEAIKYLKHIKTLFINHEFKDLIDEKIRELDRRFNTVSMQRGPARLDPLETVPKPLKPRSEEVAKKGVGNLQQKAEEKSGFSSAFERINAGIAKRYEGNRTLTDEEREAMEAAKRRAERAQKKQKEKEALLELLAKNRELEVAAAAEMEAWLEKEREREKEQERAKLEQQRLQREYEEEEEAAAYILAVNTGKTGSWGDG